MLINEYQIEAEIADEPLEQSLGLSNRDALAENAGMLFIFDTPERYGFWMKDMRFNIDIIWIDESKKIIEISPNLSPASYPQTFRPLAPIKYVLEVNAGFAAKHNLKVTDQIHFN